MTEHVGRRRLSPPFERDVDALVAPPLALDPGHRDATDLAGRGDVRATAGLQVHARDFKQADAARAARRLHRHRAHQFGLTVEFLVTDPRD